VGEGGCSNLQYPATIVSWGMPETR
jgi:hypothetical protein